MARQNQTPVAHARYTRADSAVTMTSGRAGKTQAIAYIPLLRGDSAAGRIGIDLDLAEMPRPLLNGVQANIQAWFVPKSAHPQFTGADEFMHSYVGEPIKALGAADRTPPPFFTAFDETLDLEEIEASEFFRDLGIHIRNDLPIHSDLVDAFWLIYNFRLAAHSSRLTRAPYMQEDLTASLSWPRAFWPSGRFSRVVPDYERALIVGTLDLDVAAGQMPLLGFFAQNGSAESRRPVNTDGTVGDSVSGNYGNLMARRMTTDGASDLHTMLFAEMEGQSIGVTLADIDKARTTQAFAKLRASYAGNDSTGFQNDDAILATLMSGLKVPDDQFKRPWLLDSKRVGFSMAERHATDGTNLDKSVTQGRASAVLSLNVPQVDSGGVIIVTVEVLPERLDERQSDEWLHITTPVQLPDPLRDIQNPEPVDLVLNRRLDVRHGTPNGLYGYEPLNDKWNRAATRLGGAFFQADPANPFTEQRSAIWQSSVVNPSFTADHFLAPASFPHYVFSDTNADAFEVVARHSVAISGLTMIGDVLHENNDDYEAIEVAEG